MSIPYSEILNRPIPSATIRRPESFTSPRSWWNNPVQLPLNLQGLRVDFSREETPLGIQLRAHTVPTLPNEEMYAASATIGYESSLGDNAQYRETSIREQLIDQISRRVAQENDVRLMAQIATNTHNLTATEVNGVPESLRGYLDNVRSINSYTDVELRNIYTQTFQVPTELFGTITSRTSGNNPGFNPIRNNLNTPNSTWTIDGNAWGTDIPRNGTPRTRPLRNMSKSYYITKAIIEKNKFQQNWIRHSRHYRGYVFGWTGSRSFGAGGEIIGSVRDYPVYETILNGVIITLPQSPTAKTLNLVRLFWRNLGIPAVRYKDKTKITWYNETYFILPGETLTLRDPTHEPI